MSDSRFAPYQQHLQTLTDQRRYRNLPPAGENRLCFASNDYLNINQNPDLLMAPVGNTSPGAQGSRLVVPHPMACQLEAQIAHSLNQPHALVFATGFQANISVLAALLDSKVLGEAPLVFSDRLNHASMHLGCQLAGVRQIRYRHLDYQALNRKLARAPKSAQKFILSESLFSMDGDVADIDILVDIAKTHDALLYIDEAHAIGVLGKNGLGLCAEFGDNIDVVMGTFSKALGSQGAYVATAAPLYHYLINHCQGFIYSTAPSPMQVKLMQKAWQLIPHYQPGVNNLLNKAKMLRTALNQMGYDTGNSGQHLIPIILGDEQKTLDAQGFLREHGVEVAAIRPPSVPPKQSRLRIALTLAHTDQDIQRLINLLLAYNQKSSVSHTQGTMV